MPQINVIEVPTSHGFKTIEVHHNDITQLPFDVDLLVISAFSGQYFPTPNTVISALQENMEISAMYYANEPELDLRNSLGCWVSKKIDGKPIKYLGCVESIARDTCNTGSPEEVISNLFGTISMMHYRGVELSSIAMPILGTGNQRTPVEKVLPILIEKSVNALNHNTALKTIYFVEWSEQKAGVIDDRINEIQNRSKESLKQVYSPSNNDILEEILSKLIQLRENKHLLADSSSLNSIIETVKNKDTRFVELAVSSRIFLEGLLKELVGPEFSRKNLYVQIQDELTKNDIAGWNIHYFHAVRVFCNYFVHIESKNVKSLKMNNDDLHIFLFSLNRLMDFLLKFGPKLKSYQ